MTVTANIQRHLPDTKCTFVRTVESAVTTAWGVSWNEMQISRDILQNFYDANRHDLQSVAVTLHNRDVRITGPAVFDLERLFYLGSEKTSDDVGQYGEGFKAAATCLLRDYGVTPIGVSGTMLVHVRLADTAILHTKLRPLMYDFYTIDPGYEGALLVLASCSPVLARELEQGMTHFFFDQNPLLGGKIWESWDHHYALYHSKSADGHIFYRRLKRATISSFPVIPVIHKPNERIEKRIKQDRDRNAFEDKVLGACYDVFTRHASDADLPVLAILKAGTAFWERGHALLSALASHKRSAMVPDATKALFGDQYYAASVSHDAATQLRHEHVESLWRTEGRRQLPAYFTKFGVPSAATHLLSIQTKALAEQQQKARAPTRSEAASVGVLHRALDDLAPVLVRLFTTKHVRYSVADTDAILGALKHGRGYQSIEVYLAATVFISDFARALAVFLHEHAHIFGYDGSRGFTDALTELLEALISHRAALDTYEHEWQAARQEVLTERGTVEPNAEQNIAEQIQALDRDALLQLLERVPGVVLRPLLTGDPDTK
jgi:hypothetical protein